LDRGCDLVTPGECILWLNGGSQGQWRTTSDNSGRPSRQCDVEPSKSKGWKVEGVDRLRRSGRIFVPQQTYEVLVGGGREVVEVLEGGMLGALINITGM